MCQWEACLITSLNSLKLILPVFAFSAGTSVFVLLKSLVSLIMDGSRKEREASSAGFVGTSGYERMIRRETGRHVWFLSAGAILGMLLMGAAAFFHRMIIRSVGPELFALLYLFLAVSTVFCVLQKAGWKSAACGDLVSYAELFAAAAHDIHGGIRMMLTCPGTDIPFRTFLLAMQDDNPGISGTDLMKKAGSILGSKEIGQAFTENGVKKGENNYGELRAFGSGVSVLSFMVILILCFLL